jgi:hypothetical protein
MLRHLLAARWIYVCLIAFGMGGLLLARQAASATAEPLHIALGPEVVALDGPWRFRVGDNARWAAPDFDDAVWETVDLRPSIGAHDSDVGLMGYVPGWQTRGHAGYMGYAWYRIRVSVTAPAGQTLALIGPTNVDSAYQVFVNGRLLGGVGDFSHSTPAAYGTNRPATFPLVQTSGPMLIAVRVWMGPLDLPSPDSGGIHIAPAIGTSAGVEALYQLQWVEVIRGYILDAALALGFLLLAAMTWSLTPVVSDRRASWWLIAALLAVALLRANQAIFFWGEVESVHGFELTSVVLLIPLMLGAWTIAWCKWLDLPSQRWIVRLAVPFTLLHMALQSLHASWFYGVFPHALDATVASCIAAVRLLFVLLTLYIVGQVITRDEPAPRGDERWYASTAILLIAIGLFAQELSALRIPGIWFPFGTGVSRTQYAYLGFDVAYFLLLSRRLSGLAQPRRRPS